MSAVLQPHQSDAPPLRWINRRAALGTAFHGPLAAQPVADPHRVARSGPCARRPGWPPDRWRHGAALGARSGCGTRPGMQPPAAVCGGRQSGVRAGQPGDGRALPRSSIRALQGDFSEVERLRRELARPREDSADPAPADRADAGFPPAWAPSIEVSCSS